MQLLRGRTLELSVEVVSPRGNEEGRPRSSEPTCRAVGRKRGVLCKRQAHSTEG